MTKSKLILTVMLVAALAVPASAASEHFDVDGIRVIIKSNPGTPVISASFILRGGLPHYGADRAGIESMIFRASEKGSAKFPKEELQSILARTGASLGSNVLNDYSTLFTSCLRRDFEEVFAVFADVIANPTFDADEVALVKERMLNDARQSRDDADTRLRQMADELHYAGHPYSVQPQGSEETLEALTLESIKAYHASEITKARALVVIVGDIDRQTAENLVRAGLGGLPRGEYNEPVVARPGTATVAETQLEERDLPTNYIRGYYKAPSLYEDDYMAMTVALRILRSRLFEEVRTKRNLTYAVSSGMASRRDNYGMLYVTAVKPDTTLRVMLEEVRKIQEDGITEKELKDHLNVMVTRYLMGQQTNANQAAEYARYELVGGGYGDAETAVERMRSVTVEDIQRVCKKYIQNIDFVMLGDPSLWMDPLAADRPNSGSDLN